MDGPAKMDTASSLHGCPLVLGVTLRCSHYYGLEKRQVGVTMAASVHRWGHGIRNVLEPPWADLGPLQVCDLGTPEGKRQRGACRQSACQQACAEVDPLLCTIHDPLTCAGWRLPFAKETTSCWGSHCGREQLRCWAHVAHQPRAASSPSLGGGTPNHGQR